jgi:hypothetical protein
VPTHDEEPQFTRDWKSLTSEQRQQFLAVLRIFLRCLQTKQFDASLRVKQPGYLPRTKLQVSKISLRAARTVISA